MVIDPREGNSNAQARMAQALLFQNPRVNNHFGINPEECIPFITWNLCLKFEQIKAWPYRAKSKAILTGWYCPAYCFNHVLNHYFVFFFLHNETAMSVFIVVAIALLIGLIVLAVGLLFLRKWVSFLISFAFCFN